MAQRHQLKILDGLITSAAASVEGYRSAAAETSNPELRARFTDRAEEAEDVLLELETRVRQLGGEPGPAAAQTLATPRPGRRYSLTLAEIERREIDMAERFERALASTGLDPETRAALTIGMAAFRARPNGAEGVSA